ncbi:MAG: hypothetical protein ACI8QF_004570 [Limisphaerales bacterium]|jgi:hypothetical protein
MNKNSSIHIRVMRWPGFLVAALLGMCAAAVAQSSFRVEMRVDFGADKGQAMGSLFELRSPEGRALAGAGFLETYNTQARSDRRKVTFYVAPPEGDWPVKVERLPRPTPDSGVYLFDKGDRLFSATRSGATDNKLRYWDANHGEWIEDRKTIRFETAVGDGFLGVASRTIYWNGKAIRKFTMQEPRLGAHYYADGFLVVRRFLPDNAAAVNEILAIPWSAAEPENLDLSKAVALKLRSQKEFVYAYGQQDGDIIAATNTGGVYRFDGRSWVVLVEPKKTSFQVYTTVNYDGRLLLGHYPTGELWEVDGREVTRLEGWPPVLSGVSKFAREAQTTAIYGGSLFVGVWPWGEVWRHDRPSGKWDFFRRLFDHPELTDKTRHPYEAEAKRMGLSAQNAWGQRVTSMVPFGDSLYISTSSKTAMKLDPKPDFLLPDKWKDFGAVYRVTVPGQLTVSTRWVDGPTTFVFEIAGDRMRVLQDEKELGRADVGGLFQPESGAKVKWGVGVYGALNGRVSERAAKLQIKR